MIRFMGRTGRPPKPTALHVLGETRPSRQRPAEPVPDELEVLPPPSLAGYALETWQRLAPDLRKKGVLSHWDRDALAAYCVAADVNEQARLALQQDGILARRAHPRKDTAEQVRSPAFSVFAASADLIVKLGGRFGLTPADRAGLRGLREPDSLPGEHLLTGYRSPS